MAKLEHIINSVLNPGKEGITGNTLIIHNHLSQLHLFGIRQGVELLPTQDDDFGTRKKFLDNIWKQNQIDLYIKRMWDLMICQGQFLLYLRPTKNGSYKVYFYSKEQFRAYYNADGELSEIIIRYSYKIRQTIDTANNLKWIRLRITSETIEQSDVDQQPAFEGEWYTTPEKTETFENTLKFVPCVVVKNSPTAPGENGVGEFDWLKEQIESHDRNEAAINSNLDFFGSPSLVSSRSPNELLEAIDTDTPNLNRSRTLTSAGGWYGASSLSTRKADPSIYRGGSGGIRVKRIVGNVQPEERFGYISPDPISPDHIQHIREKREAIHFALGGIDERGISANATAYEMKSIYGRLAATASKKCRALYDHGLCKLFEMAIAAEEDLYRMSFAAVIKKDIEEITDEFINDFVEKNQGTPPGIFGLPPLGNRLIKWRFTGPVFEDSPTDIRDKTISARNFQELGVRSLEALKTIFQNKTDKELEGMLSGGYPFRYMSSVASTTGQMINLYQQMLNVPNPDNPNEPLAFSIPLAPLINRSIETLYKELDYDPRYDPVNPGDVPTYNTGSSSYAASLLSPTGTVESGTTGNATPILPATPGSPGYTIPKSGVSAYPTPLAATGILPYPVPLNFQGITGEPLGAGIQQGGKPPEYSSNLPTPGGILSQPATSAVQSQQPLLSSSLPPGTPIPPDLAVTADQPGSIWQQLFPNFSKLLPKSKPSKRPRKK